MMELKLYVWEDVLCEYTCGMIVALAHNKEEAIDLVNAQYDEDLGFQPSENWAAKPCRVVERPAAFYVHGGG